jgi:hypothetical protein
VRGDKECSLNGFADGELTGEEEMSVGCTDSTEDG